jgi:pyruvate kinase
MSRPRWHRTKIVCTLGPSTDRPGVLEGLLTAGMDVARVNMSHGSPEEHAARIVRMRRLARQLRLHVAVLVDLPGPKFRLGTLPEGTRELRRGAEVILAPFAFHAAALPVPHRKLLQELRPGEAVYLADGAVKLQVVSRTGQEVTCRVLHGGKVSSGSGINLPDSRLSAGIPTKEDRRHIARAVSWKAEWLGVSFVRSAGDLARVRRLLPAEDPPLLVAKIERAQALMELSAIIDGADGVMVARGDLGVETDLAQIALIQKRIIALANAKGRPVITATQMLESMVEHEQPTRAEVTDIANAVLDGTDAAMLSAETAIGKHPVAAVKILERVLSVTENHFGIDMMLRKLDEYRNETARDPLSAAACDLVRGLAARAIITPVHALEGAMRIARFRPDAPILAVTDSDILCRRLALAWGVLPLLVPKKAGADLRLARGFQWLLENRMARPGDSAIMLSASESYLEASDILRIVTVKKSHRKKEAAHE